MDCNWSYAFVVDDDVCSKPVNLVVRLVCSLNMLEGDTGYGVAFLFTAGLLCIWRIFWLTHYCIYFTFNRPFDMYIRILDIYLIFVSV